MKGRRLLKMGSIKQFIAIILAFLLLLIGCTTQKAKKVDSLSDKFLHVEELCKELIATPSFTELIDSLVEDSDEKVVYTVNYGQFEFRENPEKYPLYKEQTFNKDMISAIEYPPQSVQDAFRKFTYEHGDFLEGNHIIIDKTKDRGWICIDISYESAQLIDVHLIKGNPLDALYHTSIFYNPGINNHWYMEFVLLSEDWYLVCYYSVCQD